MPLEEHCIRKYDEIVQLEKPNCKDTVSTYFDGINSKPKQPTDEENEEKARRYNLQQKQRYNERQIRKYKRLENSSTDKDNQNYYKSKVNQWTLANNNLIDSSNGLLRRDPWRESTHGILQKLTNYNKGANISVDSFTDYNFNKTIFKDKKEMSRYLNDKYMIKFSDSKKYPIDEKALSECINFMDKFNSYFKSFDDKNMLMIPRISVKASSGMKGSVGYYQYNSYSKNPIELALNSSYYGNIEYFKKRIADMVDNKWWPENYNTNSVFVHEYGHHISNSLRVLKKDMNWTSNFIDECLNEYNKNNNTTIKSFSVQDILSKYGCKTKEECFAEAFAEYFGGSKPREFATIFGSKLEQILKGIK